jgi:hypothetical protein
LFPAFPHQLLRAAQVSAFPHQLLRAALVSGFSAPATAQIVHIYPNNFNQLVNWK